MNPIITVGATPILVSRETPIPWPWEALAFSSLAFWGYWYVIPVSSYELYCPSVSQSVRQSQSGLSPSSFEISIWNLQGICIWQKVIILWKEILGVARSRWPINFFLIQHLIHRFRNAIKSHISRRDIKNLLTYWRKLLDRSIHSKNFRPLGQF